MLKSRFKIFEIKIQDLICHVRNINKKQLLAVKFVSPRSFTKHPQTKYKIAEGVVFTLEFVFV